MQALAEPVAERRGLLVVEVAYRGGRGRGLLRLVLDKPGGGISLTEIEGFHREFDAVLDVHDLIPGSYVLEVSSPGAERPLKSARDFELFAGRPVVVASRSPLGGRTQWHGVLGGISEGRITLQVDGGEVAVPLADIAWARLELAKG